MIIEYHIGRLDLVKSYFYNLRHSRRTQLIIFDVAALVTLSSLFRSYRNHGNLVFSDLVIALLLGLGLILVIPVLIFLTSKTQNRILSISQEGIETKIGSKERKILWKAVDSVVSIEDRILITGKTANVYTIPASAFANDDLRNKFIKLTTQYHENAKNLVNNKK